MQDWRYDCLRKAGYDPEAAVLVSDSRADLHDACELLKALIEANDPMPVATALRILL